METKCMMEDLIDKKVNCGQILTFKDGGDVVLVTKTKKVGELTFEGTLIQKAVLSKRKIEHRKDWFITAFVKHGSAHDYEVLIRNI